MPALKYPKYGQFGRKFDHLDCKDRPGVAQSRHNAHGVTLSRENSPATGTPAKDVPEGGHAGSGRLPQMMLRPRIPITGRMYVVPRSPVFKLRFRAPGSGVAGCARAGASGCGGVTTPYAPTCCFLHLTHELVVVKCRKPGITATSSCVRCRGTAAGNHFARNVPAGSRPVGAVRPVYGLGRADAADSDYLNASADPRLRHTKTK